MNDQSIILISIISNGFTVVKPVFYNDDITSLLKIYFLELLELSQFHLCYLSITRLNGGRESSNCLP